MPGKRTSAAFEQSEVSLKRPRVNIRPPKMETSAGSKVGVPFMMTEYILPLRQIMENYRQHIQTGNKLLVARQKDLAKYNRLGRKINELRRANAPTEVMTPLATKYSTMSQAFELFRDMARKEQRDHYLMKMRAKRQLKEVLVGAIKAALVFGKEFLSGDGKGIWDEIQHYKQLYERFDSIPSLTKRMNLFD